MIKKTTENFVHSSTMGAITAEVKILDPSKGNVMARTLTDLYGRYLIILREGEYILEAKNRDGSAIYSSNISVGKFRAVAEKIILENNVNLY